MKKVMTSSKKICPKIMDGVSQTYQKMILSQKCHKILPLSKIIRILLGLKIKIKFLPQHKILEIKQKL